MSKYILEGEGETRRLLNQKRKDPARQRLLDAGLAPGMSVVDAGCGPGTISQELADILGPTGSIQAFDLSSSRIATAQSSYQGVTPAKFLEGRMEEPPIKRQSVDFVVCQFVLEFCENPAQVIQELSKLLVPGGTLLVVDADGIGINNWPMPEVVEAGIPSLLKVLEKTGFDAFVGRKLFHLMRSAGLKEVTVSAQPWLTPGEAGELEIQDWRHRFEALRPWGLDAFGGEELYDRFVTAYLEMLADPDALKFIDIFSVHGKVL